jgi:hypothetical protein
MGMFRAAVVAWEALKKEGLVHCFDHCLDVDREAHSTEMWKKTRSAFRRELVEGAQRNVTVDPENLSGDDEGEGEGVFFFFFS